MSIFCTNFPAMDSPFRPDCRPSPDGGRAYQEQKMNGCRLPSSRSAQRWIRFSCHPHYRGAGRFAVPLFSSSNRAIRSAFPYGFQHAIPPIRAEELSHPCDNGKNLCPPTLLSDRGLTTASPSIGSPSRRHVKQRPLRPPVRDGGRRASPRTTSIIIEPGACWTSAGGPFKPPGPVIPNASFEASQNQTPFPKRSGSTHPRHPQQERLLSKSQSAVSQSR